MSLAVRENLLIHMHNYMLQTHIFDILGVNIVNSKERSEQFHCLVMVNRLVLQTITAATSLVLNENSSLIVKKIVKNTDS